MQETFVNSQIEAPLSYSAGWLFFALSLILASVGSILFVYYLTRRKEIKSLSNLDNLAPHSVDINKIRRKYMKLIDEIERNYDKNELSNSECFRSLSALVRLYYCEAMGFHAEVMSLADIRRTKYESLAKLIAQYYPDEFNTLEQGDSKLAILRAREILEAAA